MFKLSLAMKVAPLKFCLFVSVQTFLVLSFLLFFHV